MTQMTIGRRSLLKWSAATLALAGCADVNYDPPAAAVAARFDGTAPARTGNRMWWTSFRDSQLDQLITAGNARNLDVRQAVEAVNEARAAAEAIGANDLPGVDATAGAQRGNPNGTGTATSSSVGASASWVLDIFGANRNARRAAAAQLDAAYLSADVARLVMESGIANAYVDMRYYQANIALTQRSLESRRRSLDLTRTQFDLGGAARLDVLQAEQLVAEGEAQLPAYEVGFDQALARLATLTGQRIADLRPTLRRGSPQPRPRFSASVGVPAEVVRERPDVNLAERQYAAAAFEVGVAQAAFWPSVSLSGSISPTQVRGGNSITYWAIGPTINLPIFQAGNIANLKGAESRAVQAKLAWEQSVLNAIEEVESGLAAYNRDARNIAAQQRLVSTSSEAVELSRTNFSLGEGTFMNVLDAERSYLSAQQSLSAAERQRAADFIALSVAAAGRSTR
ncbi:efflux transporter outer membrane subunit [Paenirhodobacter populi]|uniref:Efflux transporter outer membrane subunit n=1 Tax=Paenirhodobacter populi TaxID=2306993 RepID=A0A443KDP3_9RHOB|nr:efflux transporter outer membrane subunit [Sinirhodobacter populi]RWR05689.1 efflux transporter outer membrane subunit [Sinirhodobacter populi]RWR06151.1 efflux transporter outer membrane subunit [Sinirhodobacter populi]RWR17013.1 efflux transporter outer membrane subunit [Sinirhodobacter populi]RWR30979.1 efflux transporter outer membrane subunit [Sinirhodobacter populi]